MAGRSCLSKLNKKKPHVRWKKFQTQLPTADNLKDWFQTWPDAGIALILGPISGVFVIDVDGAEAHAALIARLGEELLAPKAITGSHRPFRYHLFFRCPDIVTNAKATPWHKKLEFRGYGGIVILPPSRHESGRQYEWAQGRSPDELQIPALPPKIIEALQQKLPPQRTLATPSLEHQEVDAGVEGLDIAPSTRMFLHGVYANGPGWNERLFRAACDCVGRDIPIADAEPLLLAGAGPWDAAELDAAMRTISSAYNRPREPSRM